jgi:predicted ATP-grasp superfamily ATP-dependent carboligase
MVMQAENDLAKEVSWNAQVISEQEFETKNNLLLTAREEKEEAFEEASRVKRDLEGQVGVLNDLLITNTDQDIVDEINSRLA